MNKLRLQQKRSLMCLIRSWFTEQGFFELETPLLVPSPGMEAHLHGFRTIYIDQQGQSHDYFLPTSPEFAIKKALGLGFDKVFEIARVFRNHGELGPQHHPEFNMLEWYRPGNYLDIMDDVEALLYAVDQQFSPLSLAENFHLDRGIKKTSIVSCFHEYAKIDVRRGQVDPFYWQESARNILNESVPDDDSFSDTFFRIWMKIIEPNLGLDQPEIVYDYPASMAALSKLKEPDKIWAERFELYIQGIEIANAYSELTDSEEQLKRFGTANEMRALLQYQPHPVDNDLILAVGKMKPTGGIAIGIERLLMVLTGEPDISQFFLQPFGGPGGATKRR